MRLEFKKYIASGCNPHIIYIYIIILVLQIEIFLYSLIYLTINPFLIVQFVYIGKKQRLLLIAKLNKNNLIQRTFLTFIILVLTLSNEKYCRPASF